MVVAMSAKSANSNGETTKALTPAEIKHARELLRAWARTFKTQQAAADAVGVNQGTLSSYLKDDGFGVQFLRKFANVAHKPIDVLIGRPSAALDIAIAYHPDADVTRAALAAAEDDIAAGIARTPAEWWRFLMSVQSAKADAAANDDELMPGSGTDITETGAARAMAVQVQGPVVVEPAVKDERAPKRRSRGRNAG